MSLQSRYEWSKERDYNASLEKAEMEALIAEMPDEERADYERRKEEYGTIRRGR